MTVCIFARPDSAVHFYTLFKELGLAIVSSIFPSQLIILILTLSSHTRFKGFRVFLQNAKRMSLVGVCGVNVSALKKVTRFDNSEHIFGTTQLQVGVVCTDAA